MRMFCGEEAEDDVGRAMSYDYLRVERDEEEEELLAEYRGDWIDPEEEA